MNDLALIQRCSEGATVASPEPVQVFARALLGGAPTGGNMRWVLPPTARMRLHRAQAFSAELSRREPLSRATASKLVANFIADWTWLSRSPRATWLLAQELQRAGSADSHSDARTLQSAIARFWIDRRLLAFARDSERDPAGCEVLRRLSREPFGDASAGILAGLIRKAPRLIWAQYGLLLKVLRHLVRSSEAVIRHFDQITPLLLGAIEGLRSTKEILLVGDVQLELVELAAVANGHPGLLVVATRLLELRVRGSDIATADENTLLAMTALRVLLPQQKEVNEMARHLDESIEAACTELEELTRASGRPLVHVSHQLQRLRRTQLYGLHLKGMPEILRIDAARRLTIERAVARTLGDGVSAHRVTEVMQAMLVLGEAPAACDPPVLDVALQPTDSAALLLRAFGESAFAPADPVGFLFAYGTTVTRIADPLAAIAPSVANLAPIDLRRLERQAWLWSLRDILPKAVVVIGVLVCTATLLGSAYAGRIRNNVEIAYSASASEHETKAVEAALDFLDDAPTNDPRRSEVEKRLSTVLARRALRSEADVPSVELCAQAARFSRIAARTQSSQQMPDIRKSPVQRCLPRPASL